VEIVFHAHHAVISDDLRSRAERVVHKAAARLRRAVDATVRFEEDGPTRRVEIVLHAPRHRPVVAEGEARLFGPALTAAAERLQAQVAKITAPHLRARAPRAGVAPETAADASAFDGDTFDGDEPMTIEDELEIIDEALGELRDAPPDAPRRAANGS